MTRVCFFWADTGYGDCDNPCWEWENKPYAEGLMRAFHKEVSSVLCEGLPLADARFSSPTQEFEVFKQLFGRITINRRAVLNSLGDCGFGGAYGFYRSVNVTYLIRGVTCLVHMEDSALARRGAVKKEAQGQGY